MNRPPKRNSQAGSRPVSPRTVADPSGVAPPPRQRSGQEGAASEWPQSDGRRRDGPRGERDRRDRSRNDRPPADYVLGVHACMALLTLQPERVRRVHLWSRDRALCDTIIAAATAEIVHTPPEGVAGDHLAQGVALDVQPYDHLDLDALCDRVEPRPGQILLALDSITDTRNLGAILRAAAFFGVAGAIVPQDRAARVTPVAERVARGGASMVPVAQVTNLARSLGILRDRGWWIVGTALDEDARDLWTLDPTMAIVLVLGAEDKGLRPLVRRHCDLVVALSGSPAMQSLNVASFTATALAILRRPAAAGEVAGSH